MTDQPNSLANPPPKNPVNTPLAKLPKNLPTKLATEFVCTSCGHRAAVEFSDPTAFRDPEPVPGKNRWAQEQALAEAQQTLEKLAKKTLPLVRCPACQKLDATAQKRVLLRAAAPLLGIMPALFMLGIIITIVIAPAVIKSARYLPITVGATAVVLSTPLVILRGRRKLMVEAEKSTRFLSQV